MMIHIILATDFQWEAYKLTLIEITCLMLNQMTSFTLPLPGRHTS